MTWLLKIKRRAQNAAVAWLDWPGHVDPPDELPWVSAQPVSLPGDEGWVDEDLTLNERIEAEAVAQRVIDNLRHIHQDGGAA